MQIRKTLLLSSVSLLAAHAAVAQPTQAQINTEIQTKLPSGQQIPIIDLREVLTDMNSVMFNPLGVTTWQVNLAPCTADTTGANDATAAVAACDALRPAGSTLDFPAGTYKFSAPLVPAKAGKWQFHNSVINSTAGNIVIGPAASGFILDGGGSTFNYTTGVGGGLNRAVRIIGNGITINGTNIDGSYSVVGNITVGATSFQTAATNVTLAALVAGDWIDIIYVDLNGVPQAEMKQVVSVSGSPTATITPNSPFAQAFTNGAMAGGCSATATCWPIGWFKIQQPPENIEIEKLKINVIGTNTIGLDVQPSINTYIHDVELTSTNGFSVFGYLTYNLKFKNNRLSDFTRQTEFSQLQFGEISENIWRNGTTDGLSLNSGGFGTTVTGNHLDNATGGGSTNLNSVANTIYSHNVTVCSNGASGTLVLGGYSNQVIANSYSNCTEGAGTVGDSEFANGVWLAKGNSLIANTVRNATNGIHIAGTNSVNNTVGFNNVDSTVGTPIVDAGIGTQYFNLDNTGTWQITGGLNLVTGPLVVPPVSFINMGVGAQLTWPNTNSTISSNLADMVIQNNGSGSLIFESTGPAGNTSFRTTGFTTTLSYDQTVYAGWIFSKPIVTTPTTVAGLPTCNAGSESARGYVTDQNTAVAYRGAVTGGGATRQGVLCSGGAWIQN